jgi:hypothetical protein
VKTISVPRWFWPVIFYGTNAWSYTRLGRIEGVAADELRMVLGSGDVTIVLSTDNGYWRWRATHARSSSGGVFKVSGI